MESAIPKALQEIIEEFRWCEGQEKLELLIQYANSLPPLPEWLRENRSQLDQVPECLTPVSLQAENQGGRLIFHFEVPPESPMVRGYAALMKQGLDFATPEEILKIPGDFFHEMGLQQVLSFQRLNGLAAILAHMKQIALKEIAEV
jgi:cysteine desulfuration protein SufE